MKKTFLKFLLLTTLISGSFFAYKYWEFSKKWIGVIYLGSDSFSHKQIGEFTNLEQCKMETEAKLKTNPKTDNGRKADRYFCARGCLIDSFSGQISTDEYQCLEEFKSNNN